MHFVLISIDDCLQVKLVHAVIQCVKLSMPCLSDMTCYVSCLSKLAQKFRPLIDTLYGE